MAPVLDECPVCGFTASLSQLRDHVLTAHPDVSANLGQARDELARSKGLYNRRVAIVAGPVLAVWFVGTVLGMTAGWFLRWPFAAVIGYLLGVPLLVATGAAVYADRARREELRRVAERPHPCPACGAALAGPEARREHMRTVHPDMYDRLESRGLLDR